MGNLSRSVCVLFLLINGVVLFSQDNSEYRLIWSDEFNQDGAVDADKWTFETGFVRNEEEQWYQPDNAFCKDGCLVIEGRKEKMPNPDYIAGSKSWKTNRKSIEYTSSSIHSRDKFSFQYGRLEVRAKVSNLSGTWPAIWTLGNNCEWPSCGEVDLMENYGGELLANFVWGTDKRWKGEWDVSKKKVKSFGKNWEDSFHIWRMDWNEKSMRIYIDDKLVNEVDLSTTINGSCNCEGENPFHQPHYILLNLALGSNGGKLLRKNFPNQYLVDYVRVYSTSVR